MTLILIALWIIGSTFQWYWLVFALLIDIMWIVIKLNFQAVLIRRSVEQAFLSLQPEPGETPPPSA